MEKCWGWNSDYTEQCEEDAVTRRLSEDGWEPICQTHADEWDNAEQRAWEKARNEHKDAPCQYCGKVTHNVGPFKNFESDSYGQFGIWGVDWVCSPCRTRQIDEWYAEGVLRRLHSS